MKKKPLYIAFSTQKGGMGKTALSVIVASYFHYIKGYNVAVIDCDYPQYSISNLRKRETDHVMRDDFYKQMAQTQFKILNKSAYSVVESSSINAIASAAELIAKSEVPLDIIFFDLAGTLNIAGVIKTISEMDYIFSPISADRFVAESTLQFAVAINDNIITLGKGKIKGLYLIWNMVDRREKSELYDIYENVINGLGLNILETAIPDSKRFRREFTIGYKKIFRSTLFPPDKSLLKGSKIADLTEEIINIIKE